MLEIVVVDTNVLVHAQNPAEKRFKDALEFCNTLLGATVGLGVDPGFNIASERNQSKIAAEYLDKLQPGSVGHALVALLASNRRMLEVAPSKDSSARKTAVQLVRNKRDRTFLLVAEATADKVLVSHDFLDFSEAKRGEIRKRIGVRIIEARKCLVELT